MSDKDSDKTTTFHRAAFIGNATLLTSLLDEGADVNATIDQVTPLHLAAGQGHEECVRILLSRGADLLANDKENMSALHRAVKNNHQSIVNMLVKQLNYKEVQLNHEKARMDLTELFIHNGAILCVSFNDGIFNIEHSGFNKAIKTTRADLCRRSGKWYYEVTIKTGLPSKIGWMSIDSNIDNPLGLGGDSFSYAYDGRRKYKWHSRRAESYGQKWTVGDVVGCYADLDQGSVSFSLNGEHLGEAFTGIDGTRGLFPAVSLNAWDQVSINFGTESFKYYTEAQYQPLISPTVKYNSPLHIAAINGREECGEVLLEHGADVNERNWEGCTASHLAAMHKHPEFIEMLLDKGASTEERQAVNAQSTLHKAAYFGESECIEVLLDHGAVIDSQDKRGRTALFYAVMSHHMECLQVMIDRGAHNYPEDRHARSLLHMAAAYPGDDTVELISFLLQIGHDVDGVDESGKTSLHWAVMSGNVDAARELISRGANVNHADNQQMTPLHMCGTRNSVECAQLLLDHGADTDLSSALLAAASFSADSIVSLLLQSPSIDVDGHTDTQPTALFAAASLGDLETAKLLLEHCADPNTQCASASNRISLHGACESGFVQMVKLLLEHKALPNLEDDNGETALHLAAKNGHLTCLNELLLNGGDANKKNNNGTTPLDYAALSGHTDVVMRLIEVGAEMNYKQPLMAWTQPAIQGDVPPPLVWATVTAFQNKYYLVGGLSEHDKPGDMRVYSLEYVPAPKTAADDTSKAVSDTASQSSDEAKDTSIAVWKKLHTTGDVPEGRYHHKTVLHHHELYILGGYTLDTVRGRLVGFDVIHVLDLVTLQWTQRSASGYIPPALRGFSASKMHNKAFIYGGKHQMRPTKKLFVLDLDTLEWTQVEGTAKDSADPIARANHCGVFFGKRLFLLGGVDTEDRPPATIDIFDPETMTWQAPPTVIGAPANVSFEWALVVRNYQVLVFGGFEDTPFWVFNYDEVNNTVTWINPKVSGNIPRRRVSQCGDIADNKLAMFGGSYKNEVFDDLSILITEEESFPLESDLRKVVDSTDFHDVEIILEDRTGTKSKFFAHKIILDTRSSHFRALISDAEAQRGPEGSSVVQVHRNDISRGVFALLLEFIYTDSVRAPPQMALELVHVTKKYLPDRHMRLVHQIIRDVGHTDNHQAVLQEQVFSAYNNPKHSDIAFILPDTTKFYAHKVILGSRCDHFRALFSSGFDESKGTEINVTGVKQEIFLKVMQFLYSNHTEITHEDAVDLLIAADLYRIPDLITNCEVLLMRHLDDDNVIGMFQVAEMYNAAQLRSCSLAYIMRDYDRISQSDDYKALTKSQLSIIENKRYDQTSRSSHSSGSDNDAHDSHTEAGVDTHLDHPWANNNNNNNNSNNNNNNLPNNNNHGDGEGEKKFSHDGSQESSSTMTLNNNNIENNNNNNTNLKKSKTIKRKTEKAEDKESSSTAMALLALTTAVITASIFWFAYKRVQRE